MFIAKRLKDCCFDSWSYILTALESEQSCTIKRDTVKLREQNQELEHEIADYNHVLANYEQINSRSASIIAEQQVILTQRRSIRQQINRSDSTKTNNSHSLQNGLVLQQCNHDEEINMHQQFVDSCHDQIERAARNLAKLKMV